MEPNRPEKTPLKPVKKVAHKPLAGLKREDLKALGIGLELAAVIGGGAWAGHWADEHLGTGPWLAFTGVMIGLTGGCWHALKVSNGGKMPEIPGITTGPKKNKTDATQQATPNDDDTHQNTDEKNADSTPADDANPTHKP